MRKARFAIPVIVLGGLAIGSFVLLRRRRARAAWAWTGRDCSFMVSPTLAGLEEHVMAPPRLLRRATRPYRPHWCRAGGHLGGLDQRCRQTRPTPSGSVFV